MYSIKFKYTVSLWVLTCVTMFYCWATLCMFWWVTQLEVDIPKYSYICGLHDARGTKNMQNAQGNNVCFEIKDIIYSSTFILCIHKSTWCDAWSRIVALWDRFFSQKVVIFKTIQPLLRVKSQWLCLWVLRGCHTILIFVMCIIIFIMCVVWWHSRNREYLLTLPLFLGKRFGLVREG